MTTEPEHPTACDPSTREARMLQIQKPVHSNKEPACLDKDQAQPKNKQTKKQNMKRLERLHTSKDAQTSF